MNPNHRALFDLITTLFLGLTALVVVVTLAVVADVFRVPALAPPTDVVPPTLFQMPTQPGPASALSTAQAHAVAAAPTATGSPAATETATPPSGSDMVSQATGTSSMPPTDTGAAAAGPIIPSEQAVLSPDSPAAATPTGGLDEADQAALPVVTDVPGQAAPASPTPLPTATPIPAQVYPVWPTLTKTGNTAVVSDVTPLPTAASGQDRPTPSPPGGTPIPLRVMVPSADTVRQLQQRGVTNITQLFPSMDPAASFSPGPRMPLQIRTPPSLRVPGAAPASPFKTLAILVQFADEPSLVSASDFDTLLFDAASQTVRGYYREVSYNQLDIVTVNLPSSLGWQTAPQDYGYYVNGHNCTGGYPNNCQRLTEDLVAMVDPVVDFSQYDNNHDGWVDTVFIIHAGTGAEAFGGGSDLIWSHSWWTYNEPLVDGVWVGSYTTEPEYWFVPGDMTHGVYVHELGHAFGLPDLYDIDNSSKGVGDWSLMSGGSWNGYLGDSPAQLDAWSRTYLEFNAVTDFTNLGGPISIPNVEQNQTGSIYRLEAFRVGEYWLLENRQPIGSDSLLPGSGLLIWHVDENLAGNNHNECKQVNVYLCGATHFRVALEQADGRRDLEYNRNGGDTGDPFPGITSNTQFAFTSNPNNTSYYSSRKPSWEAHNISASGSVMNALIVASALYPPTLSLPSDRIKMADQTPAFTWNAVTTATRYNLQVSADSNFASPALNVVISRTSYTPSALDALPYGVYYWRVAAGDQGGLWSDWSVVRALTVSILSAPKNAAHVIDTTPAFTWNAVTGAVQYHLEVYDAFDGTSFGAPVFEYTGPLRTVSPTSPLSGGQHWWRVQVDRGSGFEGWTPAWTLTVTVPPPGPPALLTPPGGAQLSTTTPQLTWKAAQGGYQYQIQIDRSGIFSRPLQDVTLAPGSPLSYTVSTLADGGAYYWRVRALNDVGVAGTWSSARTFVLVQLPAPALLGPASGIRTANPVLTFSWKSVSGADHYQIRFSTVSSFAIFVDYTTTDTSYTPASELPDGRHFWRVRAVSPEGVGGKWSATRNVIVDITGPVPPVLISPADNVGTQDTTPTFSWNAASSAVRYYVQVLASDQSTRLWEGSTATTSITLPATSKLSYGEYYWQVQAEDSVGNVDGWSAPNRFTITLHLLPKDGAVTTNPRPTFTWAAAAGALQYEFELRSAADNSQVGYYTGAGRSYLPPAPLVEGTYTWHVRVDTGSGFGDWLPDWSLTITPPVPGKPPLLVPANNTLTNVDEPVFYWQSVAGGHTYQIQIDNNSNFSSPEQDVVVGVGLVTYTASSLSDGPYWWRVRAINSLSAPGAWSGPRMLTIDTTPPDAPRLVAPLDAASITNTKLVLIWGAVSGAARYELQLDLDAGFPLPSIDARLQTSYKPPTPLSREHYFWRVRPVDKAGNVSAWSETWSFTLMAGITAPLTTPEDESSGTPTPAVEPTEALSPTVTAIATELPTANASGTPLPAALPYEETFDSGLGWQATGAWEFDPQTAYQGAGWFASGATRGLSSTLTADTDIDLRLSVRPELGFWQKADLPGGDQMVLDLSLDGGASWLPLDPQAGATFDWSPRTVDLSPYRGYVIRLRFRLDTLQPVPEGVTAQGWWVDALTVVEAPVEPPTLTPTAIPTDTLPPTAASTPTGIPVSTATPTDIPTATPAPTETPLPTATPMDVSTPTPGPLEPTPVPTDVPTGVLETPGEPDQ